MVTNILIMSLLILLTAAIHKVEKQKYNETLIFPQEVPPPPKIIVPKVRVIAPPQPEVVKLTPPKIVIPKIQPPPEIPKPVKLDQPEQPKLPPAPPKAVAPPPQPKVGLFSSPKPTETANNQVKPDVKSGGFGDPIGARLTPTPTSLHWWRWEASTARLERLPARVLRVKARSEEPRLAPAWRMASLADMIWARWLLPALPTAWSAVPANQAVRARSQLVALTRQALLPPRWRSRLTNQPSFLRLSSQSRIRNIRRKLPS
jgi:hypothetical protein